MKQRKKRILSLLTAVTMLASAALSPAAVSAAPPLQEAESFTDIPKEALFEDSTASALSIPDGTLFLSEEPIIEEEPLTFASATEAAEGNIVEIPQTTLANGATATSSANHPEWNDAGPSYAFDGNAGTAWHTDYDSGYTALPHSIEFSLGEADTMYKVNKLSIQGKQGGNNGYIKTADIEVLGNTGEWVVAKQISLTQDQAQGTYEVPMDDIQAAKIRIKVTDSYNEISKKLACIGEIHVWKLDEPGEPLPEPVDYNATDDWKVKVIFDDANDEAGVRSKSLPMTLKNVTAGTEKQLTANVYPGPIYSPYTFTFKEQSRYVQKNGQWLECEYNVIPGRYASVGYEITSQKTGEHEFTVTYRLEHRYVSKTIHANWVYGDEANRPEITVQLIKHKSKTWKMEDVGEPVTLNTQNNWTYTWDSLLEYPASAAKTSYRPYYGIRELDPIEGYETTYSDEVTETIFNENGYHFDESGNLTITNTGAYTPPDKTKLQDLYDKCKDFTTPHVSYSGVPSTAFLNARAKALEVLEKGNATQEEVDTAFASLSKEYEEQSLIEDALYYYGTMYPNKGVFDYTPYTTESCIPLVKAAYWGALIGSDTNVQQRRKDLDEAVANLKEWDGSAKTMHGINPKISYNLNKGGTFTITEEPVKVNDKDMLRLYIRFMNDGIHPFSGEDKGGYKRMDSKLILSSTEIGTVINPKTPLEGQTDFSAGFETYYDIDPDKIALPCDLAIQFYTEQETMFKAGPAGIYRTGILTAPLEELIASVKAEMAKDYYPTVIPSVQTNLEAALTKAEELLKKTAATQAEANQAYNELLEWKEQLTSIQGDIGSLNNLITQAEALAKETAKYTPETLKALTDAITDAKALLEEKGENALVEEVNVQKEALQDAMENLALIATPTPTPPVTTPSPTPKPPVITPNPTQKPLPDNVPGDSTWKGDTIVTPNGTEVKPDGSIVLPDGTELKPDADGTKPSINKDGTVTDTNGTSIKADGAIVLPGKDKADPKDDTIVTKGDGTKAPVYNSETGKVTVNEGNLVTHPGNMVQKPAAGSTVDSLGTITEPDGTKITSDGVTHRTDGGKISYKGEILKPATPIIEVVKATGNAPIVELEDTVFGAFGYDFVVGTEKDCIVTKDYLQIQKNKLLTETNFWYLPKGTYYFYCHAWFRNENGIKVFSDWSNAYEFEVTATTPAKPQIMKATVKGRNVTVTYRKVKDATGYDIVLGSAVRKVNGEYRPVDYGSYVKKNIDKDTVQVTFKNVKPGTYYVGMHAFNRTSTNKTKVFSPWSNRKTVRIKK